MEVLDTNNPDILDTVQEKIRGEYKRSGGTGY